MRFNVQIYEKNITAQECFSGSVTDKRDFLNCQRSARQGAEAYFRFCPKELKPKLARAILRRAAETGADVKSPVVLEYAGVN